jgi:hypothetical protein
MLPASKVPPALFAIHLVLVKARNMAGEGVAPAKLERLLDRGEILPTLITRRPDEDTTEEFREMLAGLGEEFPECSGYLANFDRGISWDDHSSQTETVST